MEIKYLGHSSFNIRTKSAKIVTDPYNPAKVSLKFPKTEADIVTTSHHHDDHDFLENIKGEPLVIDWPGEYEKNQVRITGFASFHDQKKGEERGENTIYKFETEGVRLLHLGDLGHILDDTTTEAIGEIDILMIPVGGHYTIDPEQAVKVMNEIEPSIVIPMHFGRSDLNQSVFGELKTLEDFLKEAGAEDAERVDKLTVKKDSFNIEEMKVVVLSG